MYDVFLFKNTGATMRQNERFQKICNVSMFAYWSQKLIHFLSLLVLFYYRAWLTLNIRGTKIPENTMCEGLKVKCKLREISENNIKRKIKPQNVIEYDTDLKKYYRNFTIVYCNVYKCSNWGLWQFAWKQTAMSYFVLPAFSFMGVRQHRKRVGFN
jgi:hypothetical protein